MTIKTASEDYLKLLDLVIDAPHGEMIAYHEAEAITGVTMNDVGRRKLQRAILRAKREYVCEPGVGYRLASAPLSMEVLTDKLIRIDRRVRRAEKAQKVIQATFLNELPEPQQKAVLFLGSVFGAIRQAAKRGTELYCKEPRQLGNSTPVLPDNATG